MKYKLVEKKIVKSVAETLTEFAQNKTFAGELIDHLQKQFFHVKSENGYILIDPVMADKIIFELDLTNQYYMLYKFTEKYNDAIIHLKKTDN